MTRQNGNVEVKNNYIYMCVYIGSKGMEKEHKFESVLPLEVHSLSPLPFDSKWHHPIYDVCKIISF